MVDSKAINAWFDPDFLNSIKFLDGCIDAGFSLNTEYFKDVKIEIPPGRQRLPMQAPRSARGDQIMRFVPPGTARQVDIKGPIVNAGGKLGAKQMKEKAELEAKHMNEAAENLTKTTGHRARGKKGFWPY